MLLCSAMPCCSAPLVIASKATAPLLRGYSAGGVKDTSRPWRRHGLHDVGDVKGATTSETSRTPERRSVVVVGLQRDAGAGRGGQHVLDDVLAQCCLAGQLDRVVPVETGRTQP